MDRTISRIHNGLQLYGRAETVNSIDLLTYTKDADGNIDKCSGLTVPTADSVGFAKGCLFVKTDAVDGTKGLYENQGTTLLSDFNLIGEATAGEISLVEGSILIGSAAGVGSALSVKADKAIMIGNGTTITAVQMSSEATISNLGAVTLANSAVIGKVITGFVSGAAVVAAGDTILEAINKLDGNAVALATAITTVDLTTTGNTILGNEGTDTLVVNAKLASQLYHNLSAQSYTVLKIHNHDNTAEIGSLETKGEFKNQTGLCLGQANYWSYEPTTDTGTPTQLSASVNVVAVDTGMTVTAGNIYGLTGHVQLYGTLNGATVNVAGVIGVIDGAGVNTEVLHMAGVQSAISAGVVNPTTGTLSHFLANSTGTTAIDNLMCMQDSQYIENFASFNAASTDKCVEANSGTPSGAVTHMVRVLIGGTPAYIPAYASKFS